MTTTTSSTSSFYDVEAAEVYTDGGVGFTVLAEETNPLPGLQKVVRSILAGVGMMATAVALSGVITIRAGEVYPAYISQPAAASVEWGREGPDVVSMTQHMRQRAALSGRIFVKTPHPGADDDPDPDYGF